MWPSSASSDDRADWSSDELDRSSSDERDTTYHLVFPAGGARGLGLELSAGRWSDGEVAPGVHRANAATGNRGVQPGDELLFDDPLDAASNRSGPAAVMSRTPSRCGGSSSRA